jgi:hypothetical protein
MATLRFGVADYVIFLTTLYDINLLVVIIYSIIVTKMCLLNMNLHFFIIVDSATPDLYVME